MNDIARKPQCEFREDGPVLVIRLYPLDSERIDVAPLNDSIPTVDREQVMMAGKAGDYLSINAEFEAYPRKSPQPSL